MLHLAHVAFGTGTVGIMLHLALLALCCISPVVIMLHLALLALCCVGTVGIKIHLELLALYCIWHCVAFIELALHLALRHIYR